MIRMSFHRPCQIMAAATVLVSSALLADTAQAASQTTFNMVRSNGLPAACAARASARVQIQSLGFAERMTVTVSGLPSGTGLDLFTIQVPNAPFGVGWYVGDLEIGAGGSVTKTFIGRFSDETFAVAIGQAAAPVEHPGDANKNPTFKPIHTFHLGAWFNSPADAAKNGCAIVHSDSGEGIQRLNQEAAKAMAYGNRAGLKITPEHAIRWLTANAAKALGVADQVGTLEAGKQADVVVWNPGPAKAKAMTDLPDDDWTRFLCIEAASIGRPVVLGPGQQWTGRQGFAV